MSSLLSSHLAAKVVNENGKLERERERERKEEDIKSSCCSAICKHQSQLLLLVLAITAMPVISSGWSGLVFGIFVAVISNIYLALF